MLKHNFKLAGLTWFKVGGKADHLFVPETLDELKQFLTTQAMGKRLTVLGAGSNVLIDDEGLDGVVIKLGYGFNSIEYIPDTHVLYVGAGCLNYSLVQYCIKSGLSGLEFMSSIPGTIGGGVFMNAGAYGAEFKDVLISIDCIDHDGQLHNLKVEELEMKYRYSCLQTVHQNLIVVGAYIKPGMKMSSQVIADKVEEMRNQRRQSQPITSKTCGSTFRNPTGSSAWKVIEALGMRGYQHGGAKVSEMHANFLINHDNATAKDLLELGEIIVSKAKKELGVDMVWEIRHLKRGGIIR